MGHWWGYREVGRVRWRWHLRCVGRCGDLSVGGRPSGAMGAGNGNGPGASGSVRTWIDVPRLASAIMLRAMKDLFSRGRPRRDAGKWARSSADYVGSFTWVCDILRLDLEAVRKQFRRRQVHEALELRPPRTRQKGVGRGRWTHAGAKPCERCGIVFQAQRLELERRCLRCRARDPHADRASRARALAALDQQSTSRTAS
jgi:hypothetical protein